MAEKIKIYNSYYKELKVSETNEYEIEVPVDLTKYNDCFLVFKENRNVLDKDAFFIKRIKINNPKKGIVPIYMSPEETSMLPLCDFKLPYFYMYIHLGSTATGENIEINYFKVKTEYAGLRHYAKIDTSLNDLGSIKGFVGFTFDCGRICEPPVYVVDVAGGAPIVTDCGKAPANEYEIINLGAITSPIDAIYDLAQFKGYCYD